MNWEHLKVFLAIANEGSALAASQLLEVNHSTVIRRIDQLESMLGTKLFYRYQSGYRLTQDGMDVLTSAKQMEDCALRLFHQIKGKDARVSGKLTISQPGNSFIDLSDAIFAFTQLHPHIELNLINTVDTLNLSRFEADVAIRLTDTPPDLLIGRQISRVAFGVYAHRDYVRKIATSPEPSAWQWLLWTGARNTPIPAANHPDKLFMQQFPSYHVALRSNSMEDILAGLKSGIGVGIISTCRGDQEENLVRISASTVIKTLNYESVGLWLLIHPDMKKNAMIKAFLRFMTDYLRARIPISNERGDSCAMPPRAMPMAIND